MFRILRIERRNNNPFDTNAGRIPIRLFVLVTILLGAMLATFPLLEGSPTQEPPVTHAQGVMCDPGATVPTVEAIPRSPGADARYVIDFTNGPHELLPEQDGIVFRVDPQISLPSKIDADEIDIHYAAPSDEFGSGSASSVEVKEPDRRGGPVTLTIFPKIVDGENSKPIPHGARVEVIITGKIGLSNPIEGGAYLWEVGTTHDQCAFCMTQHSDMAVQNAFRRMEEAIDGHVEDDDLSGLLIDFQVELGEHVARRGDQLEFTARGFAVGTTVIFWRDSNMNGVFDTLGAVLFRAESNSQAVARCSIPVTNPPLVPGLGDCSFQLENYDQQAPEMVGKIDASYEGSNCNFINARDGEGHTSILVLEEETEDGTQLKENVENSFQVMELAGTVNLGTFLRTNSTVRVDLLDFPEGHLDSIRIGGFGADLERLSNRQIPETGGLSFPLAMPGDVLPGLQEVRVVVEGDMGDCERERKGTATN